MNCRPRCGACCVAPSISSPIPASPGHPGMPAGKPAGVRCAQLDDQQACRLFGHAARPAVCASLRPEAAMCGTGPVNALAWLQRLERSTAP